MIKLISKSHKFIFVEIYRVASRSLANSFYKYKFHRNIFYRGVNKFLIPDDKTVAFFSKLPKKHGEAVAYKNYVGNKYNDYYSFAFVRNPYDWQLSLFFRMKETVRHPQYKIIKDMDFNEYIEWRCKEDRRLQKSFLVDEKNSLLVDFIGKYENLKDDFDKVCKKLKINEELIHTNQSKTKLEHYSYYYDNKSISLMKKHFEEDFKFLNYPTEIN